MDADARPVVLELVRRNVKRWPTARNTPKTPDNFAGADDTPPGTTEDTMEQGQATRFVHDLFEDAAVEEGLDLFLIPRFSPLQGDGGCMPGSFRPPRSITAHGRAGALDQNDRKVVGN